MYLFIIIAFVILGLVTLLLLLTLIAMRTERYRYAPDLSAAGNKMIQKYRHYYFKPHAGSFFSRVASTMIPISIILLGICVFQQIWWGVAVSLIIGYLASYLSRAYNPEHFFRFLTPEEQLAHQEILNHYRKFMSETDRQR
jgi:hypothetical protein